MKNPTFLSVIGIVLIFTIPWVFNYFPYPILLWIIYPIIFYFIFKTIYNQINK
jgi:hypothetical protein